MTGRNDPRGTRRRLLATGGACLAGGLAGCAGLFGSGDGGTPEPTPTAPSTVSGAYRTFQYDAANTGATDASGPTGDVGRVWRFREAESGPRYDVGTPAVADGTAYVAEGGGPSGNTATTLYALDAATGSVEWDYTVEGTNAVGATGVGRGVVCQRVSGRLYGLDAESGEQLWSFGNDLDTGPTVDGDAAYVLALTDLDAAKLYAVNVADGRVRWSFDVPLGEGLSTPPAVADGVVYVGGNRLHALDAADGTERWSVETEGGVAAAPTVAGDRVYLDAGNRSVAARSTADGSRLWKTDLEIRGYSSGPAVASPAVRDGRVYVVTVGLVTALDAETGKRRWEAEVPTSDPPVVAGDAVYVSGLDALTALDAESGDRRWEYTTDAETASGIGTAVVLEGIAYLASAGLHAIGGTG